jgi:xanthine dehydrogenase YagR molybdenum-binding subunit
MHGAAPSPKESGVLVGIAGESLHREVREVPPGEPPQWGTNAELDVVGKPTPRIDGALKVTGAARYTFDVQLPGMLYARRIRSPHAHARVLSVDTSEAEKLPGVKAVHVVETALEGAKLRDPSLEKNASKHPRVRYVGQVVAAVAATSQALADDAARKVKVEYEVLPASPTLEGARAKDAPLVYAGPVDMGGSAGGGGAARGLEQRGNVRGPSAKMRGDVEKGFAAAELTVQGEFRTQVQTHSALETHGVVVDFQPELLTVYSSTQGTATVRDEFAAVFELKKSQVRVVSEFMGGGFGAKFGAGHYGVVAAHLSKKAQKPVCLMLSRHEEHEAGGNRPSTVQTLKVGAKKTGALTSVQLASWGTGGIATGAGVGSFAEKVYPSPNFLSEQYDVFTHAGAATAFRAPGMPQGAFAMEQLVDEIAEKLKLDPLVLRDQLDVGETAEVERQARKVQRRVGAAKAQWAARHAPGADTGVVKQGLGVAQSSWGRFVDMDSSCELRLTQDGSVELLSSVMDIGTGTRTALAQIVAEELGLQASDVTMRIGDTQFPIGPSSGGSKTLVGITPAVRRAAFKLRTELFEALAPKLKAKPEQLKLLKGAVQVEKGAAVPLKQALAMLGREQLSAQATRPADYGGPPKGGYGGVQFAWVTVDTETGVIHVDRVLGIHDCGRPINPLAVQSQVNGGVIHGVSWALYENRVLDAKTGRMLNPTLDTYKIVGAKEAPAVDVVLLEQYVGKTNTDAHGIGEPANIATAAAVANAVYNAIGVRLRELPMSPRAVLKALGRLP